MRYLSYALLSLVVGFLLGVWQSSSALTELREERDKLRQDISQLSNLPTLVEEVLVDNCEQEKAVERVVTKTVTEIKQVPYEVDSPDLPADLSRLLDQAYNDLRLRQTP